MMLNLPFPPSTNRYWRTVQGRVYLSHEGRHFRERVIAIISALRIKRMDGPLKMKVIVHPPDLRRRDVDNIQKALLDALQHAGVYRDDAQIVDLRTIKSCRVPNGICVVDVAPCTEELPDARLLV